MYVRHKKQRKKAKYERFNCRHELLRKQNFQNVSIIFPAMHDEIFQWNFQDEQFLFIYNFQYLLLLYSRFIFFLEYLKNILGMYKKIHFYLKKKKRKYMEVVHILIIMRAASTWKHNGNQYDFLSSRTLQIPFISPF